MTENEALTPEELEVYTKQLEEAPVEEAPTGALTEEMFDAFVDKVANDTTPREVKDAMARDERIQESELSKKQQAKKDKENEKFWNTMISRKEAFGMVNEAMNNMSVALDQQNEKINIFLIQSKTFERLLIEKGIIASEEELDAISVKVMEDLYGSNPVEEAKAESEDVEESKSEDK